MPQTAKEVDEASVRERILAAARTELAARGFDASSVRTIATTAGVTPAMINYYFGSKRALCEAVVGEAQARLRARLGAALAEGPSATRLAAAYFDFLAEEGEMQRLLLRDVLDGKTDRFGEIIEALRTVLKQQFGQAAVQNALSVFGAIAGYFIYAPVLGEILEGDALSPDALARRRDHVIALVETIERVQRVDDPQEKS